MERDFWPMEWLPTPTLMCWSWTRTDWGRLGLTILIAEPSCTLKELHLFCNVSRNNICFKEGFEWSTDSLSVHWCPWYDCHMQGSGDQQTLTVHWLGHEPSQKGQWCKSDHLQVDKVWLYFREEQLLLFPCWPSTHLWRHSVSSSTTSLTPGPSSELCLAPRLRLLGKVHDVCVCLGLWSSWWRFHHVMWPPSNWRETPCRYNMTPVKTMV